MKGIEINRNKLHEVELPQKPHAPGTKVIVRYPKHRIQYSFEEDKSFVKPKSAHKHLKRILLTFQSLKIPNPFLLTGLLWPKSFFVSSYHRNFVSHESMIARKEVLEGAPLPSTGYKLDGMSAFFIQLSKN